MGNTEKSKSLLLLGLSSVKDLKDFNDLNDFNDVSGKEERQRNILCLSVWYHQESKFISKWLNIIVF